MTATDQLETSDFSRYSDGTAMTVPLELIDDFPGGNVRRKRNPKKFKELRASIKRDNGVTQGVTVRASPDNTGRLQLIAGYGRREAAKLEGFETIPAVIKVAGDKEALSMMLSENSDREDLSIADEIIAARRALSLHDGDYTKAAAEQGWSEKKLRGRVVLNNCCTQVNEALFNETIKLGHAEILCQFTERLQIGTLKKIIDENWDVSYLKKRASGATRVLRHARFDTSACQTCPHNSDVQASLFDNSVGKAKCGNLECYKSKSDNWITQRREILSSDRGIVLLAIEKPEDDRNLVGIMTVGNKQYKEGCSGCVDNALILIDGINSDCGTELTDQCINTDCFREKAKVHQDSLQTKPVDNATEKPGNKKTPNNASESTKKASPVTSKQPAAVTEDNRLHIQSVGVSLYQDNSHFAESLGVAGIIEQAHLKSEEKIWHGVTLKAPYGLTSSYNDCTLALYQLTPQQLTQIKQNAAEALMAGEEGTHGTYAPIKLMINAVSQHKNGIEQTTAQWSPSKERLEHYQKGGLTVLATQSGFCAAYDTQKGEGAFKKLTGKKKSEIIDVLITFRFNWAHFVPDEITLLLTPSKKAS